MDKYTFNNDLDKLLEFARRLEHRTIAETNKKFHMAYGVEETSALEKAPDYHAGENGKGKFGNILEEVYFGKKNDSASQADFPEIGVELKASPLKRLNNKKIRVKERLVLNHFTYMDFDKETFETSHFLEKDAKILLIFYFYEKDKLSVDETIDLVDLWECLKEDAVQLKRDWETIFGKVHAGKAEEISEGDTLYLGACTKGANREQSMQKQPHSAIEAPGRALCFKQAYINHIYVELTKRRKNRQLNETRFMPDGCTIEETVNRLFAPYLGKTTTSICPMLQLETSAKSEYALLARRILGFKKGTAFYEFAAADIQVKTVRVERNGKNNESMSFKAIDYREIVDQEWEDSDLYHDLTCKFVVVIFQRLPDDSDYVLQNVRFWNMPQKDLDVVKGVWEETKADLAQDDFSHLPKIADHRIAHVRTHGKNSNDVMETVTGRQEPKRSFWLNSDYVLDSIVHGV